MFDFNCKTAFLFSKTFSYRYSLKQNLGNVKQSRAQLFCGCLHSPKSLSAVFAKTHAKPLALFEVCCGSQLSWWWPSRDLWNYMWAIMAERVVGRDTIRNRRGTGKTNILQREGYSLTSEDYHSPNATKTLVKSVELLFLFVLAWGRWITPVMPSTWCPLLSSALVWELLYISSALAWNKSLSPMSNTICKTLVASKLWLPYQGWAKVWGWEKLSLSQGDTHKTAGSNGLQRAFFHIPKNCFSSKWYESPCHQQILHAKRCGKSKMKWRQSLCSHTYNLRAMRLRFWQHFWCLGFFLPSTKQ